jgi:diguanylate cyclase (GGDEF)-like protein
VFSHPSPSLRPGSRSPCHRHAHFSPAAAQTCSGPSMPTSFLRKLFLAMTAGLLIGWGEVVITRRHLDQLQTQLNDARYQVHHDSLTGLPNREAALSHLATHPVGVVGLLDLDNFKAVNDRYGHRVGDLVLTTIAQRLRAVINADGMAARLSGDEFLLMWTAPPARPIHDATVLLQQVCEPVTINGHRLVPTASLGLALAGPHLHEPGPLIAAADEAMYDAKRAARYGDSDAVPPPRASLYCGQYPPEPTDRAITERRSTRHRPADLAHIASVSLEEGQSP